MSANNFRRGARLLPFALLAPGLHARVDTANFALPAVAAEAPAAPPVAVPDAEVPALVASLASKDSRAAAVKKLSANPPRAALVALLADRSLALRVGALEILEEIGGASAFDPWLPPADPANGDSLALWKKWAADTSVSVSPKAGTLSDDRRLSHLSDILGDNADRARRAAALLERDGAASVGFLEKYLADNPALSPGLRGRIRATEYRIVLAGVIGERAASVADPLVFGTRDKTLAAMETLRSAGPAATPVLRDFLSHPDPLVREAACDIILVCGGADAFPLVDEALRGETDPNVVQGALRSLKGIRTKAATALVARHIAGADEELALAALRTAVNVAGDSGSESSKVTDDAVIAALASKSWRVRAGALEYVALRAPAGAKDAVLRLLDDKDDFVRFAAIKAVPALRMKDALPKLREMFLKDVSLAGPVFSAFANGGRSSYSSHFGNDETVAPPAIDEAMTAKLAEAPADDRIAVIQAVGSSSALLPTVRRLAADKDSDVACAALRALSSDSDRVKDPDTSAILASALKTGPDERRLAVLGGLRLPREFRDPAPTEPEPTAEPESSEPTALDGVFNAFATPAVPEDKPVVAAKEPAPSLFDAFGASAPATEPTPGTKSGDGKAALLRELSALSKPGTDARLRVPAVAALAGVGDTDALKTLAGEYASLDTARRTALAENLPTTKAAAPLFRLLLADPVAEVRAGSAAQALDPDASPSVRTLPLEELSRPGTKLKAHELYGYKFEYALNRDSTASSSLRKWAAKILAAPDATPGSLVLACIAARDDAKSAPALERLATTSANVPVRRAAWYSLLGAKPRELPRLAALVAADASPLVREALPAAVIGPRSGWIHRFDDLNETHEQRWSSESPSGRLAPEAEATLTRLAGSDPHPAVRFSALFALMARGSAFDAEALARLIADGTEKERRAERVSNWIGSNIARVTPAMRPVVAAVRTESMDTESRKRLQARLGGAEKRSAPLTFSAYAGAAKTNASAPTETSGATDTISTGNAKPASAAFAVVFFQKPGCRECARTREFLDMLHREYPGMKVEEHNILATEGVLLNQAVCSRLDIPAAKQGLAPSVFTRAGGLAQNDISPKALADLFARSTELPDDDAWRLPGKAALAEAEQSVSKRYDALTLGVVLLAGLVDGVNPCAFATIIFFLSYLRITRRTSREMLATGVAFITGVFVAYFAAGLALHGALESLHRFAWLQRGMNLVFGTLALVAAGLSVLDAVRARRGEFGEMTLKLPAFLGDRIRKTIREGAKARSFVTAAFVTGIVVSFLELACTGQVYAPIVYRIGQGSAGAVGMLFTYNLAFIFPLVALFIATWFGLKNDALLAFQKKHTFRVKLALAGLFLLLASVIFFGV